MQAVPKGRSASKAKAAGKGDAGGASTRRKSGGETKHRPSHSQAKGSHNGQAGGSHAKSQAKPSRTAAGVKSTRKSAPKKKPARPASVGKPEGDDRLLETSQRAEHAPREEGSAAPRSESESQIVQRLFSALDECAKSRGMGHVAQDALFDWGESTEQELHPDLAFVSFERWAPYRHVPTPHIWHVVPDLVVQVKRKSEPADRLGSCLECYFQSGVRRGWVVDPDKGKIHDHESPSSARALGHGQVIDGGEVLPGFEFPVGEVM